MTQSNFKYFFVIITITLFLILLYSYYNFYIPNKISVFYINKTKCNPLKDNSKQFKIKINNEYYPKSVTLTRNKSIDFACLNTYSVKRILFWNSFFGREDYNFGIGRMKPFAKNRCPVLNCEITTDKSKLNQSNYVITHMRSSFQNIPNSRPFNQKWIFMLLESPVHASDFKPYKNLFNLTYTYKRDSNFPGGYEMLSYMYWEHNDVFNENLDFHKEKTDFSAAVISNCASKSPRLRYINQLRNYISVDLFGKCGKNCPIYFRNTKIKGDCKEIIGKSYKFYFAFENSICNDYITEKFFHILRYNIIPVVMGGGNYDYYIPKSGFINVFDYKSPKDLAKYLIYLDINKNAYNSYFKWKKYIRFDSLEYPIHPLCDICIQLQLDDYFGIKNSRANSVDEYSNKNNCKTVRI